MNNRIPYLARLAALLVLLVLTVSAQAANQCVQPPSGIIAWWPFDETSGNTVEDRVGNHTGAYANNPVPAEGKVGGSLRFNGTNYVAVPDSGDWAFGSKDFTVELWANFDVPGGGSIGHPGDIFIGNDEGPGTRNKWFFALGGGYLNFHINGPSVGSRFFPLAPFSPSVGQWYHLAVTKSGTTYTLFINGTQAASAIDTRPVPNANAPLTIGQAENLGYMNGRLDELTIYNRALTPEEIVALMGADAAGKCKNILIQPRAGGNSGSVTVTLSGDNFLPGTTVKLTRSGQPEILGHSVTVSEDGQRLVASFELTDIPTGPWDVVITPQSGDSQVLPDGFLVEAGRTAEPWVEIVGLNVIRTGQPQQYHIYYGNRGNVDANQDHFMVISWPTTVNLGMQYPLVVVPYSGSLPEPILENNQYATSVLIPQLKAGQTGVFSVQLTVPQNTSNIFVAAAIPTIESVVPGFPNLFPSGFKLERLSPASTPHKNMGSPPPGATVFMAPHGDNGYGHEAIADTDGNGNVVVWDNWVDSKLVGPPGSVNEVTLPDGSKIELTKGGSIPFLDWQRYVGGDYLGWGVPPGWTPEIGRLVADEANNLVSSGNAPWEIFGAFSNDKYSCSSFGEHLYQQYGLNPIIWPYDPLSLTPGLHYLIYTGNRDFYSRGEVTVIGQIFGGYWPGWFNELFGGNFLKWLYDSGIIKQKPISTIGSWDPNDKAGATGSGDLRYISARSDLPYSVFFENLKEATAPAQEVVITDKLDLSVIDSNSVALGFISFGQHKVLPPIGATNFSGIVDLRPSKQLLVRINASFDPNTGDLSWRFKSIDPRTGNPPTDPLSGFLPPNIIPPEGDGSIMFTAAIKPGLPTGTEIRNKATIVFDTNPPIETPEWFNTIDNSQPESQVLMLPTTQTATNFKVEWSGSDEGAGIKDYTIFVSEDGGTYNPWLTNVADTSGTFTGTFGKTYSFYSVARDLTGNVEDTPVGPDTMTQLVAVPKPGDLNGDGAVTCTDMAIVKASFGKRTGQTGFDPRANVNKDGIVDIRDLSFVSRLLPIGTKCS